MYLRNGSIFPRGERLGGACALAEGATSPEAVSGAAASVPSTDLLDAFDM
ncbi:hypothetical protein SMC26_22755 [Actinomadura fulvescens]